ncbi:MAG: arginyltransferase [Gammaproteobacteria bacterium]|nr:arginyltransferase [Gammaproteobacteria bacterium]MBU1557300.1 arginyltransferase [Gammaproteobacteria bacterium]MBU2071251.1 arginyltransferase [Gammaproteobacteria bacterium]MBU2181658.1 arginyltransferase [Gammaproteobacteria bacterium]MBU2205354.1 arginyltransferase [Gammaproteobacteria bacterium]
MHELRFGLTAPAQCSYLPQQQEQLVFLLPDQPLDAGLYQQLLQLNFRRSGEQVYTPHCPACRACQSVRISHTDFKASRSQRRLLHKAARDGWHYKLCDSASTDYFALFSAYINYKHHDSSMFPPTRSQLEAMLDCSWLTVRYLEQYHQQQLVAVSIVDDTADAFSAVYTFFHPDVQAYSPGLLAILYLIQCAAAQQKQWVYLGYQIDECRKMAYKAAFLPQQRFIQGQWHSFG